MKTAFTLIVLLAIATQTTQAQNKPSNAGKEQQSPKQRQPSGKDVTKSQQDWDAVYEQFLQQNSAVRKKLENGDTTREEIIAWLKEKGAGGKKPSTGKAGKEPALDEFRIKLDKLVKAGKLTRRQAAELYETMKATGASKGKTGTATDSQTDWNLAYETLLRTNPAIKAKVESGKATKEQVIAWLKMKRGASGKIGTGGTKKRTGGSGAESDGPVGFYAIVIGRLKTKDIELGEFTFEVDHATSMYGNRWVKDQLVGKTVTLTGVSGQFLDNLLQIKRGDTLKVRTGSYHRAENRLTFGTKFHVLERSTPYRPEDFGIPPEDFRGFHGELTGKILEAGGYEVLLQVTQVHPSGDSKAVRSDSIRGRRIRIVGFFNQHRDLFADLHQDDVIRVSAAHANPKHDELTVTSLLKKLSK